VPESADSVHYRQIVVSEQAIADDIRQRIEAGEDFAVLAAENSLDPVTKDEGGDAGWVPRGVLGAATEELVFPMEVGAIIVIPIPAGAVVIEVLEKDADHPVEEDKREPLAAGLFNEWVEEKEQSLTIVNNMDIVGGGDQDKIQWVLDRAYQS
jgi:parvulin-like peptidyl-prolyl isomerase